MSRSETMRTLIQSFDDATLKYWIYQMQNRLERTYDQKKKSVRIYGLSIPEGASDEEVVRSVIKRLEKVPMDHVRYNEKNQTILIDFNSNEHRESALELLGQVYGVNNVKIL